jgi:hypothetical protein
MQGGIIAENLIAIGFKEGIDPTNGITYYQRGETMIVFTEIAGMKYILSNAADFSSLAEEIFLK